MRFSARLEIVLWQDARQELVPANALVRDADCRATIARQELVPADALVRDVDCRATIARQGLVPAGALVRDADCRATIGTRRGLPSYDWYETRTAELRQIAELRCIHLLQLFEQNANLIVIFAG